MYEVIYLQLFCPVSLMADIGQCEFNLAGNFYIKDVLSVSLFVPVDRYLSLIHLTYFLHIKSMTCILHFSRGKKLGWWSTTEYWNTLIR